MHSVWEHTHYKIFLNNEKKIDNKNNLVFQEMTFLCVCDQILFICVCDYGRIAQITKSPPTCTFRKN